MKKLSIIDVSRMFYVVCAKNNTKDICTDDFSILKDELDTWIEDTLNTTNADYYLIFGDIGSFRRDKLSDYKADRKGKEKPKFLNDLYKYCQDKWGMVAHKKLEADDLVIINHNYWKDKYDCIICSGDSDSNQYACKLFNPASKEFDEILYEEAELHLWTTVLAGGHNGYKGLNRCGVETAKSYLETFMVSQYKAAVLMAYINGIDKEIYNIKIDKINELPHLEEDYIPIKTIKSSIKGLGLIKGIKQFYINFTSTYLLRTKEDCIDSGIDITDTEDILIIQEPVEYKI